MPIFFMPIMFATIINAAEPSFYKCKTASAKSVFTSTANICATNINSNTGTDWKKLSEIALHDFIADCENIVAVKLTLGDLGGWQDFEILESTGNLPGKAIFSTWVHSGRDTCDIQDNDFLAIPTGKIPVVKGAKYFLKYVPAQYTRNLGREKPKLDIRFIVVSQPSPDTTKTRAIDSVEK